MPEVTNRFGPVVAHAWEPIEDLPKGWHDLCRLELHAVHRQWTDDRGLIRDEAKVKKFQEQIALRWAIETGIIERLYTVDRGITVQILNTGMEALGRFHAQGHLTAEARALISDQREALEMVMDLVGRARDLSSSYIKELHHRLTLSQETCDAQDQFGNHIQVKLLKGEWKKQPNNPSRSDGSIHEYYPPDFVQDGIDQLLSWHKKHEQQHVCPEVEAAWFHHRFAQIHPFQDGNGRVARALTNAVFLKADYLVLVIRDAEHRARYLDALESADKGDLRPLVDLFADVQMADLQDAIQSIRELRGETIVKVTGSLAERARRRQADFQKRAAALLDDLVRIAHRRLEEAAAELQRAFGREGVEIHSQVLADDPEKHGWWSRQIITAAQEHGYYAEIDRPRRWVSLHLGLPGIEREETRLVVSLHAIGRAADYHAATAFLTWPIAGGDEDGNRTSMRWWETRIVAEHPYRFGAETATLKDVEDSFREWLEATIENGLSAWGERL